MSITVTVTRRSWLDIADAVVCLLAGAALTVAGIMHDDWTLWGVGMLLMRVPK